MPGGAEQSRQSLDRMVMATILGTLPVPRKVSVAVRTVAAVRVGEGGSGAGGAFGVLWGKSDASGSINLLLQHLLDTAAVAERLWDEYLAPTVRARIDECCERRGRVLFALLCGLHDVGKASPAFQAMV